jgi:hypothetical protein
VTLTQWLELRGYLRPGSNKAHCPFQAQDRNPSAIVNPNSIYCFSCSRRYSLWDFQQAFGVVLEEEPESGSNQLARIKGLSRYSYGDVLFSYEFKVKEYP